LNLYGFVGNNGVNMIDIYGNYGWQFPGTFADPLPGTPGYKPTPKMCPSPSEKSTGDTEDDCCLNDIIKGKDTLIEKFETYRKTMRKLNVNAILGIDGYFYQRPQASCEEQNVPIIGHIKPIPKCWRCEIIEGSMAPFGIGNHVWVECKSYYKGRVLHHISFDVFFNVEGGGEPSTNRNKYPFGINTKPEY
jgi:hypothetical protein